jgi:uncharacterized protein (TIGR03435 family)
MSTFGLAFTSALVDFVWQGTVVALALLAALHTLGRRSAQIRYGLCLGALTTLMALPVVTTASRFEVEHFLRGAGVSDRPITVITDTGKGLRVEALIRSAAVPSTISTLQPWILPIWSLGVLLFSLRLVAGGLEVRALRRSITAADDVLRDRVASLASRMGLRGAVQVGASTRADGPSVIGWLRPLILLPPATLMGLTPTQLDAVLAHELAHVRRHDYLVNVVQMVAETLLFYHPAVWWVSKRLRIERELCCDDEAVRRCGDATAYAKALVTMAKQQVPAMAIGSAGGSLTDRVRRLLGVGRPEPSRSAALGVLALALMFVTISFISISAQQKAARFEVASVRPATAPATPGSGGVEFLPGGTVRATRVPIMFLVAVAYDTQSRFVNPASDSIEKLLMERFAIDAKASTSALPPAAATFMATQRGEGAVLREMLKTLLTERFKLTAHFEKREFPIYELRVAPGGHKLTPAARSCEPQSAEEAISGKQPCGFQGGGPAGGFRIRDGEITGLVRGLTSLLDRVVVDRTGITGRFDIDLPPWSRGLPAPERLPAPGQEPEAQPDPNGPSIFTVLQPFGLRLEATRGQIEILVVDHVERPTAN